ncbi:MAG TPA: von Willebrand factor type A domain-containing protein [Ferruginibacter sp.]|jgi:Ca-activated chloride channel family protein|nr:von Willebrand factor type A domain-containing protein [Ferruginibacter sp.]
MVCNCSAQYYLRGVVKNEQDQPLQNVNLMLLSNKLSYHSGVSGEFGINAPVLADSLSIDLEGYQSQIISVTTNQYLTVVMKALPNNNTNKKPELISIATDQKQFTKFKWHIDDESHFSIIENEAVTTVAFPNSGFSLNPGKETYNNIRRFINTQSPVPPDQVRTEELLNYFNLNYKAPDNNDVFKIESIVSDCPWNADHQLLYLTINAKKLNLDNTPPCNLVFLIDASASMDLPSRLSLVKAAFQLLIKNLRAVDTISIVTYGGTVREWLKPTSGADKQKLLQSIEEIIPDGETPGADAIKLGYKVATKSFIKNGNNRIILATDGDFNVGETSEKALEDLIEQEKQTGVVLSCLDVGSGDPKDSTLKVLAKKGNGNYAYLDNITTAEKILMKEMTQHLFAVAENTSLNVQFNSDAIKEYRLIGFDNKKEAIDSSNTVPSEEIGSGNTVMAIYEITATTNKKISSDSIGTDLAKVSLTYNLENNKQPQTFNYSCVPNYTAFNSMSKDLQFATATVLFGMKLRNSLYVQNIDWKIIQSIAKFSYQPNNYLQNELVKLIDNARKVYSKK